MKAEFSEYQLTEEQIERICEDYDYAKFNCDGIYIIKPFSHRVKELGLDYAFRLSIYSIFIIPPMASIYYDMKKREEKWEKSKK